MYAHVNKTKENQSRAVATSISQKKNDGKQSFGFVDNRPENIALEKLLSGGASQAIQRMHHNATDIDSRAIQLWKIRYQNLDTGTTVIAENSLKALPDEALQEIATNGFANVELLGEDADPEILQEMAKGMLEARRMEHFQAPNIPHRNPSVKELEKLEEQIQLPASYGGLAVEDPRLTGMRDHFMGDATNVSLNRNDIDVFLDIDQLKHQPQQFPIGTRQVRGGNKFNPAQAGSAAWHIANTLVHMQDWAANLPELRIGEQQYHGQARPVKGIHYEGYCVKLPDGRKLVLFHCYPSDDSNLKL